MTDLAALTADELRTLRDESRRTADLVDVELYRRDLQPDLTHLSGEETTRHLTQQARVVKVAREMVLEEGFPGELVVQALVADHPRHAFAIGLAVEEAVAESRVAS